MIEIKFTWEKQLEEVRQRVREAKERYAREQTEEARNRVKDEVELYEQTVKLARLTTKGGRLW